ncbi:hypothetical protein BT69DRAFT_1306234 [Atractiella rhizophila]|nr:hypothetical protein BT69DRAFT_1306234 [Atractiella rhizophila]
MLGDGLVNELGISAASDGKKKAGGMSLGAVGVLPTEIKEGEAIPLRNPEAYESASRKEKERNSITTLDVQVPRKSDVRRAFAMAEDEEDAAAARAAEEEFEADRTDFGYERRDDGEEEGRDEEDEGGDELQGTIEGYMVSWVEEDWDYFDNQF